MTKRFSALAISKPEAELFNSSSSSTDLTMQVSCSLRLVELSSAVGNA